MTSNDGCTAHGLAHPCEDCAEESGAEQDLRHPRRTEMTPDTLPPLPEPPTLPSGLLALIGEYGMARTDGASQVETLFRWEQLIGGVKVYAREYAVLAVKQEREACAKLCDERSREFILAGTTTNWEFRAHGAEDCAAAIRNQP
jgi:hypothetical protein